MKGRWLAAAAIGAMLSLFGALFIFAGKMDNKEEKEARAWTHFEHRRAHGMARFHDDEKNVTCWLAWQGVSCIPDSQLAK